jgi:hypothetical protein
MLFSFPRLAKLLRASTPLALAHSANLERIFQPFVQAEQVIMRQFGGTGLGLTVRRGMAAIV